MPEKEGLRGKRLRRKLFLGVSAATLIICLVVFRAVLVPFVLALVVAYVLFPLVAAAEGRKVAGRTIPRWVVVLGLYAALLGALSAVLAVAVPRLVSEVNKAALELPAMAADVRTVWLPKVERHVRSALAFAGEQASEPAEQASQPAAEAALPAPDPASIRLVPGPQGSYELRLPDDGLLVAPEGDGYRVTAAKPSGNGELDLGTAVADAVRRATENTEETAAAILHTVQTVVRALSSGIFTFFLTLMLSAYLIITSDRILGFFRSLYLPPRRSEFDNLVRRIDRGLTGVVRGQLLICLVNGVLTGIGLYALGIKYWVALTLLATVMSLVPIFGAILSSVPAVAVALQDGVVLALLVLGWIVVIHQIEANLLNPKIMGDAAKVHPVLVVFALLAGAHVAGIMGALLGVPVLSIGQSLFLHYRELALGVPRSSQATSSS